MKNHKLKEKIPIKELSEIYSYIIKILTNKFKDDNVLRTSDNTETNAIKDSIEMIQKNEEISLNLYINLLNLIYISLTLFFKRNAKN